MRITVLTGGTSAERDVAIASAVQVVRALGGRGHAVSVVDTARGLIPQGDEPKLLSGDVGSAPPSSDEVVAPERGVLLSGLGNIPAIRDADVLFLALHAGATSSRSGPAGSRSAPGPVTAKPTPVSAM